MCIDSPSSASYESWFFDVTAYDFSQLNERRDLHTEAQVMEAETSFTAVERDLPLEEEKGWRNLRPTHKMYLVCWFVLVALATKQFLPNSPLLQFP